MTGAEMVVQVLDDEGVPVLFGYSGGAILPTYDAVFQHNQRCEAAGRSGMPLSVPANEQGAGFMAAGYARASGQVPNEAPLLAYLKAKFSDIYKL